MRFVIVTGLSGAGKTQAVHALEDIGYYCVDNLPPALLVKFAQMCQQSQGKIDKVAMVIDTRVGYLFDDLKTELNNMEQNGYSCEILFLDAEDNVLIKRYKENRRKHPLSGENNLADGIRKEREILQEIRERAKQVIDTSRLTARQLKDLIIENFADSEASSGITINVLSFGFKYGIPLDADLVFDVRFLPNPFYIPELKNQTGLDAPVREYVFSYPQTTEFCDKLFDMISYLLPHYVEEGKGQLVIGIGCTGGQHRSVSVARWLAAALEAEGRQVTLSHRDVEKK